MQIYRHQKKKASEFCNGNVQMEDSVFLFHFNSIAQKIRMIYRAY